MANGAQMAVVPMNGRKDTRVSISLKTAKQRREDAVAIANMTAPPTPVSISPAGQDKPNQGDRGDVKAPPRPAAQADAGFSVQAVAGPPGVPLTKPEPSSIVRTNVPAGTVNPPDPAGPPAVSKSTFYTTSTFNPISTPTSTITARSTSTKRPPNPPPVPTPTSTPDEQQTIIPRPTSRPVSSPDSKPGPTPPAGQNSTPGQNRPEPKPAANQPAAQDSKPDPSKFQIQNIEPSKASQAPDDSQTDPTPNSATDKDKPEPDSQAEDQSPNSVSASKPEETEPSAATNDPPSNNFGEGSSRVDNAASFPTEILPSQVLPPEIRPTGSNIPDVQSTLSGIILSVATGTASGPTTVLDTISATTVPDISMTTQPNATATGDKDSSGEQGPPGSGESSGPNQGGSNVSSLKNGSGGSSKLNQGAVIGGLIGGIGALAVIFFLFWFWKRRSQRQRQGALPSPLAASQDSRGPTSEGGELAGLGGSQGAPVVLAGAGAFKSKRSRNGSKSSVHIHRPEELPMRQIPNEATSKGTFLGWWNRRPADNISTHDTSLDEKSYMASNIASSNTDQTRSALPQEKSAPAIGSFSNAQKYRISLALEQDNFDPFADAKASANGPVISGNVAPPRPRNPFADSNAVPMSSVWTPAATSMADIRRSHAQGQSMSAVARNPPPTANFSRVQSIRRESQMSEDTFGAARAKFHSNQFDLELFNKMARESSEVAQMPSLHRVTSSIYSSTRPGSFLTQSANTTLQKGVTSHDSFTSAYLSQHNSMVEWSEPGPDVGRWDSPTIADGFMPIPSQPPPRPRRPSDAGDADVIVGQAL